MRAIVIATDCETHSHFADRIPTVLLPLVDRPVIQHVVESLIDKGVTEFDFVLNHWPEKIEALLGNGARWGVTFRFHLAKDSQRPFQLLTAMRIGGPVLLIRADRLPMIATEDIMLADNGPVVFGSTVENEFHGCDWFVVAPNHLARIAGLTESEVAQTMISLADIQGRRVNVTRVLSVATPELFLESQLRTLEGVYPELLLTGREVEKGIWLSRNVSLHPTARIVAPAFIGPNCRIGKRAQIGPNAVISSDCVLDALCKVENSLVMSGSYVGEALELSDAIVDKNRLLNSRVGATISVVDNFILSSLTERPVKKFVLGMVSRLVAFLLFIVVAPVFLFALLTKRSSKTEVVRLPEVEDENCWTIFNFRTYLLQEGKPASESEGWKNFVYNFVPGLLNIARGDLHFVGVAPRSAAAIRELPADWRSLYLKAKSGIVTEAFVYHGARASHDETYAAETVYAVSAGFRHDLKLLMGYFARLLQHPFSSNSSASQTNEQFQSIAS